VARRLAQAGYAALAPEIYHRTGPGLTIAYNDFASARPHMAALTNEGLASDVQIAIDALRKAGQQRVGVVGFCVGGFAAFEAACRTSADATVAFYGGGIAKFRPMFQLQPLLGEVPNIRKPVLCFFGEKDPGIAQTEVEAIRSGLGALTVPHDVVVYPDASHAFFCDARPAYHPASAADAWQRTLAWFGQWLR
jgi:carboxymethylenebutenolidase